MIKTSKSDALISYLCLVYTHLFSLILKLAYVNHTGISSCNQPILTNDGKVSCSFVKVSSFVSEKSMRSIITYHLIKKDLLFVCIH